MKNTLKKVLFSRKGILGFLVIVVLLAFLCPAVIHAADYLADNDPLVTLSYLTEVFAPSLRESLKNDMMTLLGSTDASVTPEDPADNHEPTDSATYIVLELSKGQCLTSAEGSVELIVRPGSSAMVFSEYEDNGLSDISEMKEVLSGEEVGINHALIIPRSDGRGIVITSDKAFLLVRGNYKVVDAS